LNQLESFAATSRVKAYDSQVNEPNRRAARIVAFPAASGL
jgi:hypothetical protein